MISTTTSVASGDSLTGVVSYGKGCVDPKYYNVHTRVASHLDFINAVISVRGSIQGRHMDGCYDTVRSLCFSLVVPSLKFARHPSHFEMRGIVCAQALERLQLVSLWR